MKAFFIIAFEERSEGPEGHGIPTLGGPFYTQAAANAAMQIAYDFVKEQVESMGTCDDSNASHFYIMGDDITMHWWIVTLPVPNIHLTGLTALREDAFGTEKHTAIQWQQGPNYHFGWIPTSLYKMICDTTDPKESGGSSGSAPVSPS